MLSLSALLSLLVYDLGFLKGGMLLSLLLSLLLSSIGGGSSRCAWYMLRTRCV